MGGFLQVKVDRDKTWGDPSGVIDHDEASFSTLEKGGGQDIPQGVFWTPVGRRRTLTSHEQTHA